MFFVKTHILLEKYKSMAKTLSGCTILSSTKQKSSLFFRQNFNKDNAFTRHITAFFTFLPLAGFHLQMRIQIAVKQHKFFQMRWYGFYHRPVITTVLIFKTDNRSRICLAQISGNYFCCTFNRHIKPSKRTLKEQPQTIMLQHILPSFFQIHLHNFKRGTMMQNFFNQAFINQKLHHILIKFATFFETENMIFSSGITASINHRINSAKKINISLIIRSHSFLLS